MNSIPAPTGWQSAYGFGINNAGQITGAGVNAAGQTQAFIGTAAGLIPVPLPTGWSLTNAYGINNLSQITGVGFDAKGQAQAFIGAAAGVTPIPLPAGWGANGSGAFGINNLGQIAGWAYNAKGQPQAFIGTAAGVIPIPFPAGWSASYAYGINDSGQIAGAGVNATGQTQAFIGTFAGLTPVPVPPGWSATNAYSINNFGQIAGVGVNAAGQSQAFIGTAASVTPIPLPSGWLSVYNGSGVAISNSGQILGHRITAAGEDQPFIGTLTGSQDLNGLVQAGWTITTAFSLNDAGQILAHGSNSATGVAGAVVVLTPGCSRPSFAETYSTKAAPQSTSSTPCITNPSDGARPQSQFVAIAGTGQPGDMLDVLISGASVGTVTVDSEGNWDALPNIQIFNTPTITVQVQDRVTANMSNTISVNKAVGPFIPTPTVPASFLPLRHGDILISSNPTSFLGLTNLENLLWGATWTHSAVFLGGDTNGTPQVAEAVITNHFAFSSCTTNPGALQCGVTRVATLEGSDVWDVGTTRIAAFTPRNPLTAAQRGGIVAYARGKSGLPYWNYAQTFGPLGGAYALWPLFAGTTRFTALLNQMNANKNLDTAFECATLVWRAYLEGTSRLVDISNPNNMTAQPGSIFSFLLGSGGSAFLDQIRPVWVVPETFAASPNLQQIF